MTSRRSVSPTALAGIGGMLFAVIWSGSFVATKVALGDVPPLWLAGLRLAAAGALLFAITFPSARRRWGMLSGHQRRQVAVAGLLSQGAYLAGTYWSLVELPTGVVNVIVSTVPLISVPAAWLILRERLSVVDLTTAVFGVVGVAIVVSDGQGMLGDAFLSAPVLVTIASVLALAAGNVLMKPHVAPDAIIHICALQMLVSAGPVIILAILREGVLPGDWTGASLAAFGYLVLVGSIIGTYLWYKTLEAFTARGASMFFLFTPVFGLAIGWSLLEEPVTVAKAVGAAVVGGSILFRTAWVLRSNSR